VTKKILMIATAMSIILGAPILAVAASEPVQAQATQLIDGQVTKIDETAGKLTIKHGPIKKFDMDGMTMVFQTQDPAMLKAVKVGDKVKFDLEKIKGQFTVTKIEKLK
jgi:Cu/Ag efflux protein CusF